MEKQISVHELAIGMYVCGVTRQSKKIKVKSAGVIKTQQALNKLKNIDVDTIIIDVEKSRHEPQKSASEKIQNKSLKTLNKSSGPKVSLDSEIGKASVLYGEAKELQHKLLDNIKQGQEIDLKPIVETSENIVESIMRNPDALSCMSRLRNKDDYLVEHSLNVSILMSIFARHLGEDEETIKVLALAAFLHDIGKILVPDAVLQKPGKLTPEEFDVMRKHVLLGIKVIDETPGLPSIVREIIIQHHERLDGSGYPYKLTDSKITKYGRMIAIVDGYDAMTAERVYKEGMHSIKAFKILKSETPHALDEELVDEFIKSLGVYPVGTLVKLQSGKLGLISKLNQGKPLNPCVRVFYNSRMNQAIPIQELDLSKSKYQDHIDCCIKPEEFGLNLMGFFKAAFLN